MKYITREQLKSGAKGAMCKTFTSKAITLSDRTLKFVISSEEIDRGEDIVTQTGIDLSSYIKNPVVLAFHNDETWPIGKCVQIGIEDGNMTAVVEFIPADIPIAGPVAEAAFQLAKNGFLNATSIGFRPVEYSYPQDRAEGINFERIELYEFSLVAVPANRDALIVPETAVSDSYGTPENTKTLENTKSLNNLDAIKLRLTLAQAMLMSAT